MITMGKSERSALPKHTKVILVICLHHVAIDAFSFTSMEYIILWIARCLT